MDAKIAKWGNSLAMRLPANLADELGLEPGSEVEIRRAGRELRLLPKASPKRYELSELLKGVTTDNSHPEIPSGPDVGREIVE